AGERGSAAAGGGTGNGARLGGAQPRGDLAIRTLVVPRSQGTRCLAARHARRCASRVCRISRASARLPVLCRESCRSTNGLADRASRRVAAPQILRIVGGPFSTLVARGVNRPRWLPRSAVAKTVERTPLVDTVPPPEPARTPYV